MKNIAARVGAVASALLVVTTFAEAETRLPGGKIMGQAISPTQTQIDPVITKIVPRRNAYKIGCVADGTPVEFPNDLVLSNKGASAIPAGTKVNWAMAGYGFSGVHTLSSSLQSGASVRVSNVLGSGVEAGKACMANAK